MDINPNLKISKLVNFDYHILLVLNRFGICTGFGEQTIAEYCQSHNINVEFFIEIVKAFLDKNYLPNINAGYTLKELVEYLIKTHNYYRQKLTQIEQDLEEIVNSCCRDSYKDKIALIFNFFSEYKTELLQHMQVEEGLLYPSILKIEQMCLTHSSQEISLNQNLQNYLEQHLNVEEKIVDIKIIILKYLPLEQPTEKCNRLLFELYDFEKDLLNHQSIEERILIPRALNYQNCLNEKR